MHVDVGTVRPIGHEQEAGQLVRRNVRRAVLQDLDLTKTLIELQDHIEGLTLGILDIRIEELPMRLQCHTIGVPSHWMRLLRIIA